MLSIFAKKVVEDWLHLGHLIEQNKKRIFDRLEICNKSLSTCHFKRSIESDKEHTTLFMAEVLPYAVGIIQWAAPEDILTALNNANEVTGPDTDAAGLIVAGTLIYLLEKGYEEARAEYAKATRQGNVSPEELQRIKNSLECWKASLEKEPEKKDVGRAAANGHGGPLRNLAGLGRSADTKPGLTVPLNMGLVAPHVHHHREEWLIEEVAFKQFEPKRHFQVPPDTVSITIWNFMSRILTACRNKEKK